MEGASQLGVPEKRLFRILATNVLIVFLGVLFILAGVSKATDLITFSKQLPLPNWVPTILTGILAVIVPAFEIALGAAILFRYDLRRTLAVTLMLLAVFLCVGLYDSLWHPGKTCGCFGAAVEKHLPTGRWWPFRNVLLCTVAFWTWRNAPDKSG